MMQQTIETCRQRRWQNMTLVDARLRQRSSSTKAVGPTPVDLAHDFKV